MIIVPAQKYSTAQSINWEALAEKLGRTTTISGGRPPLPTRLLVGLHYLKAMYDESDESVVSKWVENPYWQYFCGAKTLQHEFPCHATSLVKWRQQVGPEGIETLLQQVLKSAMTLKAIKVTEIERVNVDTTVQDKVMAFPKKRSDSHKVYRMHAPEVECIAKGKVQKHYEFGCKVVLVTTSKTNWIVGAQAIHENPYDGKTLRPALAQTYRLTGVSPKQAAVDKGFRGRQYHPSMMKVLVAGTRKFKRSVKRWVKRRCAIEPVISHVKQEHGLNRNHLHGPEGDRINALLAAFGFNLKKLFRFFMLQDCPAS